MMPALARFLLGEAPHSEFIAQGNFAPSDSVNYAILAVSALAVIVAVGIAVWQRRDLRRYRKADQARSARQAEQEHLRQDRRARRESWDPVFREIQELLIWLEDIESEARESGPLDRDELDVFELCRMQRRLENVSGRCPGTLRDPLQAVATAITKFRSIVTLSDDEVAREYTKVLCSTPSASLPSNIMASAIGAKATDQYKAAVALHSAIGAAWAAVHTERGGQS
jgi:heme exporter protein D